MLARYGAAQVNGMTTENKIDPLWAPSHDQADNFPMSPVPAESLVPGNRMLRIDSRRRWFPDVGAVFRSRQLLFILCRRNITVMYRQTVMGSIWLVVQPVISAGLLSFVFGRVAHLSSGGVPYFAFTFSGLLAWNLFSSSVTGAASSLVSNSNLFTRIYFPRLLLPLSALAPVLVNTGISCGVMFFLLVAYKIGFSFRLLFLPVWLGLALLLSLGVSLMLSSMAVFRRDVQYATQAVIPLMLFITPVAYSVAAVPPGLRTIYLLNPMATIVEGCRWSLLGQTHLPVVSIWAVAYTTAITFLVLIAGLVVFARLEWKFADVV
jgi:lipopolysaccharide transport system permease protein